MPYPTPQYRTRPVPTLRGKGRRRCSLTLSLSLSLTLTLTLSLSHSLTALFLAHAHTHTLSFSDSHALSLAGRGDEGVLLRHERALPRGGGQGERVIYERDIDNLLVRIHFIIVMIRWTGLAPWEFEFPFPGSLTSTFLVLLMRQPGLLKSKSPGIDFPGA